MGIYVFVCPEDGSYIEEVYPMTDAPPIGAVLSRGGKVYERVIHLPTVSVEAEHRVKGWQLPPSYNMPEKARDAVPAWDKDDLALFSSKKEMDEFCSASQRAYEKGESNQFWDMGEGPGARERAESAQEAAQSHERPPDDLNLVIG